MLNKQLFLAIVFLLLNLQTPSNASPSTCSLDGKCHSVSFVKAGLKLPKENKACVKGGCSGQLCVEEGHNAISTCEWKEEYACYKNALCERQANEKCGWTVDNKLKSCLLQTRR